MFTVKRESWKPAVRPRECQLTSLTSSSSVHKDFRVDAELMLKSRGEVQPLSGQGPVAVELSKWSL